MKKKDIEINLIKFISFSINLEDTIYNNVVIHQQANLNKFLYILKNVYLNLHYRISLLSIYLNVNEIPSSHLPQDFAWGKYE